jgi:uncharacterized membrane protein
MIADNTRNLKWFWYTMLCVIVWLPLALFSKLGTDAFKRETILSELRAKSFESDNNKLTLDDLVNGGMISKQEGDRINSYSDAVATRIMNLFTILGSIPVALALFIAVRFKVEKSMKGIVFGIIAGILGILGFVGLFFAFANAKNATIVSVSTGLFPMVTVVMALLFLHEKLTWTQIAGLGFAAAAIIILSVTGN